MIPSLPSLLLVLLLALWTAPYLATRAGAGAGDHGLTHIHLYMHETFAGRNATTLTTVPSPLQGAGATFGAVGVLDDELRDGPDARNSSLVGRYQGLFVSAGLVSPPGGQSAINLVFTAGERRGSTLAMLGPVLSFTSAIERAVVGGTGAFRMARGYCVMTPAGSPTPESVVYEVDLFLHMYHA
ncbi:dirigent protein 1-like [Hordeum vulgare subsp. vulgare]|uniref:Dirigent protein n=1 Tax=Hordeum vulgare subsp. vulgare TaxID=112509 RepID=A0A8I6YJX0_HORVV|nr:dirigent protein 1-like [Hordeum vulgare subsp. vulgare]